MNNTKITAADFDADPGRYILVDGHAADAPTCPWGNHFKLVGFDRVEKQYVRYTKSVFNRLRDALPQS